MKQQWKNAASIVETFLHENKKGCASQVLGGIWWLVYQIWKALGELFLIALYPNQTVQEEMIHICSLFCFKAQVKS